MVLRAPAPAVDSLARRHRLIVFRWEAATTPVQEPPDRILRALQRLLHAGTPAVALTDMTPEQWADAVARRLPAASREMLYMVAGDASAVHAFSLAGDPEPLWPPPGAADAATDGARETADGIAYVLRRLAPMRGVVAEDVMLVGEDFDGRDRAMASLLTGHSTLVSVGGHDDAVAAPRAVHAGGGPERLAELLEAQAALAEAGPPPEPARAPALPDDAPEPADGPGWHIVREGYDAAAEPSLESLFALANGYMGLRGSADEASPASVPGAYVAGLFDGPGIGREDIVVVPDWATVEVAVDGQPLQPWAAAVVEHRRDLDMRSMTLLRRLVWDDGEGAQITLATERLLSLAEPHLAAHRLRLTVVGAPRRVEVRAGAAAREADGGLPHVEPVAAGTTHDVEVMHTRTPGARVRVDVAQALTARIGDARAASAHVSDERFCGRAVETDLADGETLTVDRFVAVVTEREAPRAAATAPRVAAAARTRGFDRVAAEHRAAWAQRWARADVEIDGDERAQVGTRYAIAQLIGHGPLAGSHTSVAAKGLTGPGFAGHVFWDTDVFLLPFYSLALPEVARTVLEYRLQRLPAARLHARLAGLAGAWFPWESAASGEDVTPAFVTAPGGATIPVLTGKQEIHVVSGVAWAADAYVRATGDAAFLRDGGAALIIEAARFFASRVVQTPRGFEIHGVIGPDELHEDVDNSAFTNGMAAWNLRLAAVLAERGDVADALGADSDEAARWRDIADRMVMLRGADGLLEQHEGFFSLPVRGDDDAGDAPAASPGDRSRWRGVKQADVVMLVAMLPDAFTEEERLRAYRVYEPLTLHLSALSDALHSVVARGAGLADDADRYLERAIAIDLDDSRGNRADGLRLAAQGGVWQAVVLGCGGVRATDTHLRLAPRLPARWRALRFTVEHRGRPLRVQVERETVLVEAVGGGPVAIELGDWRGPVAPGAPARFDAAGDSWRRAA